MFFIKENKNSYKSTEEFINDALKNKKNLNPDGTPKYDYSITNYKHSELKVDIKCPIHNKIFSIKADNHIKGQGCPDCNSFGKISIEEIDLQNFIKYNLSNNKILFNNYKIIEPLELDIYIVEKGIGIELNGLYWHSFKDKNYHLLKTQECEKRNIQLIHIFEDEWLFKREIVESKLLNILDKSKWRLFARKLKIKQVPIEQEKYFFNRNHLQGYIPSSLCYGLYWQYNKEKEYLVSAMSFGGLRKNLGSSSIDRVYEMYRFCNALNYSIVGAASKLFKHFIKQIKPKQIISYADRRWSIDSEHNLYRQLGFEFDSYTKPGYFYIKGNKRYNRYNFRKDILISKYNCSSEDTEEKLTLKLGFSRIYDCGQIKYVYNN